MLVKGVKKVAPCPLRQGATSRGTTQVRVANATPSDSASVGTYNGGDRTASIEPTVSYLEFIFVSSTNSPFQLPEFSVIMSLTLFSSQRLTNEIKI